MHHLDQHLLFQTSQDHLGQGDQAEGLPGEQRGEEQAGDSEGLVDGQRRCHSVSSLQYLAQIYKLEGFGLYSLRSAFTLVKKKSINNHSTNVIEEKQENVSCEEKKAFGGKIRAKKTESPAQAK